MKNKSLAQNVSCPPIPSTTITSDFRSAIVTSYSGPLEFTGNTHERSLVGVYRTSRPIKHTVIFSLEILEKNNDECILILVIYWKKTGLLHTKISNHNIIYSSQKLRKSSSLPLKSPSWLFSFDVSLSSYKMSSSLPSSALLMPHFF